MNNKMQKECESVCEYVLPDYMGDIKKILCYNARAVPTGRFTGEEGVEVSGMVEYEILYTDSDGVLTSINTTSDYSETFKLNSEKYIDSGEDSRVVNTKIRVTGPRKLSITSNVSVLLSVESEVDLDVSGSAFENEKHPEVCTRVINYRSSSFKKSNEREYAELAYKLEGVEAEDVEIISSAGNVCISETGINGGFVYIKGENVVSVILKTPIHTPLRIVKSIPFEEKIEIGEELSEASVVADGFISSLNVSLAAENDSDEIGVIVNLIADYSAEITQKKCVEVVTDAYLTTVLTENKYVKERFSSPLYSGAHSLKLSIKESREALMLAEAKDVLYMSANVRLTEIKPSPKGCAVVGEITLSGAACEFNVDGSVGYLPIKLQKSFEENVNIDCHFGADCSFDGTAVASFADAELTADSLNVSCTVYLKLYVCENCTVERLCTSEISDESLPETRAGVITVFYPTPSDNLFSIAKRYRTTAAKIAEDNGLTAPASSSLDSPDSLKGIKKLIVF